MSGDTNNWPYPAPPGPGSNAIGVGAIGVAPVGTLPAFDWRKTILSQYADSDRITGLIETFFQAVDQTANFDAFYDNIWNLPSAQGYGLDCWGRIVGINRVLQVTTVAWFGFSEALPGSLSFGDARFAGYTPSLGFAEAGDQRSFDEGTFAFRKQFQGVDPNAGAGPLYPGGQLTSNYRLSDKEYLRMIYAKARANITNGSIPAVNQILISLYPGRGNVYVQEGTPPTFFGFAEAQNTAPFGQAVFYNGQTIPSMQYQIVFKFQPSPVDLAIVQNSGVLPKPTGIAASISIQA
ncbi:DUF2612 domain-containing protein [Methylobacterium sp. NEAU 140]|uniref:DUF2612 domain-containing protein n=1 Tax=Methylobacterium sp. NEAU 140 TaxID=3064945 RepID=UPI00273267FA|nr:DUF2612 domain-containing protein [Methylobacterium sp. NEAU 140]MDP4023715.1 DUF2612 domain-containing protein [Methylobacterium sp. NEAU 140]